MKNVESADVERRALRRVDLFNFCRFDGLLAEIQDGTRPGRIAVRIVDTAGAGRDYLAHEWGILASYMLLDGLHVSDGPGGENWLVMKVW